MEGKSDDAYPFEGSEFVYLCHQGLQVCVLVWHINDRKSDLEMITIMIKMVLIHDDEEENPIPAFYRSLQFPRSPNFCLPTHQNTCSHSTNEETEVWRADASRARPDSTIPWVCVGQRLLSPAEPEQ